MKFTARMVRNHYVKRVLTFGVATMLPAMLWSLSAVAKPSLKDVPIFGGVITYAGVLKNQLQDTWQFSQRLIRDTSVFLVAGMTLDAYILTLPIDRQLKQRLLVQISDPTYAIPLVYFLRMFYDRYTGVAEGDLFKAYMQQNYSSAALTQYEHSLFQITESSFAESEHAAPADEHKSVFPLSRDTISAILIVYDALVDIGTWQDDGQLPEHYQYLTNSAADQKVIEQVRPILIDALKKLLNSMGDGDIKQAVQHVVEDENTAEAVTVSLIDFVRLNVLKAYRQYANEIHRKQQLKAWLNSSFKQNPHDVVEFLQSQNERKLAVQIVVDGLQQGLLEGLVNPHFPFIQQAFAQHKLQSQSTSAGMKPLTYTQQVDFLQRLQSPYEDAHYLPFFKQLYRTQRAGIVQHGIASTPTISVRNLPIAKTGAKVSGEMGTGIPNFHFVDRDKDRAYYFYGNDALQLDRLVEENQVKTMFERLQHLNTLNCNAQYDWYAHTSYDALLNLAIGEKQRDFGEKRCLRELQVRGKAEVKLRQHRAKLLAQIERFSSMSNWRFFAKFTQYWELLEALNDYGDIAFNGLPDYTLIYNPWPDHFAHFKGPFSDEIIAPTGELNRLDYWLQQYSNAYTNAGVADKTLWGMAGDHGLTPVYQIINPEEIALEPLAGEYDVAIEVRKISSDEGEGQKLTNAMNPPSMRDVDIVVASTAGGNYMLDLFNSSQGWHVQPQYSELQQWRPIAANGNKVKAPLNDAAPVLSIPLVDVLAMRLKDSLDYMVVREDDCGDLSCKVRLVGHRNGKRHDEIIELKDKFISYYSLTASEPVLLGVRDNNVYLNPASTVASAWRQELIQTCLSHSQQQKWCTAAQWREVSLGSPKPDSVNQLIQLYQEPRAGTINLFPLPGMGYNTKVPGRHAGESYLEKDAFIGLWGAGVAQDKPRLSVGENGSLAPTIYQYLTQEPVHAGENGWGYPVLQIK